MHIIVCVKSTPAATNVPIDSSTGKLKTDGLAYGINPFDEYAIEEALRVKEKIAGSAVTVLSFGPAKAEDTIRAAIAMGCDEGCLVTDPAFEGSDPFAAAYLLHLAVKKLHQAKPVGAIFCGKQTNDIEAGQVGPSIGAWLDWATVTSVRKITEISDAKAVVERMSEDGVDILELTMPAVISTTKEINEPRLPSLKGKMNSKKAAVAKWSAADLAADLSLVGANSPTHEVKAATPPPRGGGIKIDGATAEQKASALVDKLKQMKAI